MAAWPLLSEAPQAEAAGDSPAVLAVRVHTLPAGLVPQLDSLVITGGHDEPPVGGEPESDKASHTTG